MDEPAPRWYGRIVEPTADLALAALPVPMRILDVGCGSGWLLREMVARAPSAEALVGVDPIPESVARARGHDDPRLTFVLGSPEALPFEDRSFDLVLTAGSFDSWSDQRAGLAELARVVRDNGRIVLVDRAAVWLPQGERARTPRKLRSMIERVGLDYVRGETLYRRGLLFPYVRAVIAAP